jgi:hypothetical protein
VLLGDSTFMSQLQQYDKDDIPATCIAGVRPYLGRPEMAPEIVKKASKAAYGLCCWVRAMEAYDRCVCSRALSSAGEGWLAGRRASCGLVVGVFQPLKGTRFACTR